MYQQEIILVLSGLQLYCLQLTGCWVAARRAQHKDVEMRLAARNCESYLDFTNFSVSNLFYQLIKLSFHEVIFSSGPLMHLIHEY